MVNAIGMDGEWMKTLKVEQNYNPNLKWETTREFNIGLDWSVLKGRLSGSIDVYDKKTTDLLYNYSGLPFRPTCLEQPERMWVKCVTGVLK